VLDGKAVHAAFTRSWLSPRTASRRPPSWIWTTGRGKNKNERKKERKKEKKKETKKETKKQRNKEIKKQRNKE
jgi:hypothetical protein